MKYTKNKATGDAGEYLFAYSVASVLEWPCRLLDIDIGIDAQIEILDEDRNSLGQFIAVQIKTTIEPNKNSISLNSKHMEYWRNLECPVAISFVNLTDKKVYIRSLPEFKLNNTIQFEREHELSNNTVKERLRELSFIKVVRDIEEILRTARKHIKRLLLDLTDEKVHEIEDSDYYIDLIANFKEMELELHKAKVMLIPVHKFVGDCGYEAVINEYMEARSEYTNFLHEWEFHIHDFKTVTSFENEYIEKFSYLNL